METAQTLAAVEKPKGTLLFNESNEHWLIELYNTVPCFSQLTVFYCRVCAIISTEHKFQTNNHSV
jgi:hypothetical protein